MPNWEKRKQNREQSTKIIKEENIQFEEFNNGVHLRVRGVDFWPGTGLWIDKKNNKEGRGVHNLIDYLKDLELEPREPKLKIIVTKG